jgi:hypothetical protein
MLVAGGRTPVEPVANVANVAQQVTAAASPAVPADATVTLVPTALPDAPPTATTFPTAIPTETPTPTNTPLPTETPTPLPPTNTPFPTVVPTATPIPPTPTPEFCAYHEIDGMLVVDMESVPAYDAWAFETSAPGYTGTGYYTWRGEDLFGTPNVGTLTYPVYINNPGVYALRLHNYHDHPDHTEGNDAWLEIPGVLQWTKSFSPDRVLWNWFNKFEPTHGNQTEPYVNFGSPGLYEVRIAGRSHGFSIDRFTLTTDPRFWDATSLAQSQSPCLAVP